MGHIISGLALHFRVFDPDVQHMNTSILRTLNLDLLSRAEVIDYDNELKERNSRWCYILRKNTNHCEAISVLDNSDDVVDENEAEMSTSGSLATTSTSDSLGWQ